MPATLDVVATGWKIAIAGSPLSDAIQKTVMHAYVDNSLTLPDMATIELSDPGFQHAGGGGMAVGSPLQISVRASGATTTIFQGEITAIEAVFDSTGARSMIRAYDLTHRLLRGRRTKAWVQMTYSDIVRELATEAGLPVGQVDDTSPVYPHVTQAAVEDWHFMRKLADQVGYRLAMVNGQLEFTKASTPPGGPAASLTSTSPTTYCPGDAGGITLSMALTGAGSAAEVTVSGFDPVQKQRVVGSASGPQLVNAALTGAQAGGGDPFGDATVSAPWTPTENQSVANDAARTILDRIGSRSIEVHGDVVGNPALHPGIQVVIGKVGAMFAGTYTLSATRHIWDQHSRGYRTSFTVSDRQDRSLLGAVTGGSAGAPADRIGGVVRGIVTNIQDTDGGMCRGKVKFPRLSDDFESDWARTVQLGAGKSRGFQVLPEVDDEVLVAFEHGDVNHPLVIGGLHNGVDLPPSALADVVVGGQVVKRQFSSRLGHVLSFDDQGIDQGTGITLVTADGKTSIVLGGSGSGIAVTSTRDVMVSAAGAAVTISGDQKVSLSSQGDITVAAGGDLNLQAPQGNVNVQGGQQVAIQAQMGATLDGGGGLAQVSGSMVQLN